MTANEELKKLFKYSWSNAMREFSQPDGIVSHYALLPVEVVARKPRAFSKIGGISALVLKKTSMPIICGDSYMIMLNAMQLDAVAAGVWEGENGEGCTPNPIKISLPFTY